MGPNPTTVRPDNAVAAYTREVYRGAMVPQHSPHLRAPLLVVGLLLLLVAAAAGIALALRPAAAGVPLDSGIPNERVLIARGLSGVPSPRQPTTPIAVDRVVTDGASTYVQFHSTAPLGRVPDLIPELSDDTGTLMNYGGGASFGAGAFGWTRFLPPWFPWHPPTGPLHGVATLGPLPPTARAAVLRFMTGEIVRIPLNLAALRQQRPYRGPLAQRAGLQLQIAAARDTSLVLGFSPFGDTRGATLTDAHGQVVPLISQGSGCGSGGFADTGLTCRQVWTYPPQRRGARLTLTIRSFTATPNAAVSNAVGAGPWRLAVVIP